MSDNQLDRIESVLHQHVERSQLRSEKIEKRIDAMTVELAANTEVTTQVRDASRALEWIRKAIIWIGGIGAGVFGIWQAWSIFAHPTITP